MYKKGDIITMELLLLHRHPLYDPTILWKLHSSFFSSIHTFPLLFSGLLPLTFLTSSSHMPVSPSSVLLLMYYVLKDAPQGQRCKLVKNLWI